MKKIIEYNRSKKGIIATMYGGQRYRCQKKTRIRKIKVYYDLKTLRSWVLKQPKFHRLYDEWVSTGYLKKLKPSIDRINCLKGYSLDNLQIMTTQENIAKGRKEQSLTYGRRVKQYTKEGIFVSAFNSISEAYRKTNVNLGNICEVLHGNRKTAGGYVWQ